MNMPILSIITFLPLGGIVLLSLVNTERYQLIRCIAFATSLINFLISLPLFFQFDLTTWQMQFVEKTRWIDQFGISYHLGIDGISLLLVLITTFISPLVILSTWSSIKQSVKGFMVSLLMLETGMIGTFCALDFFLFYLFWELMLIPMYFIIGIWGGPRRIYAAVKFFIFTMSGSVLMLIAILVLYVVNQDQAGVRSFDIQRMYDLHLSLETQMWLFSAFALAFAIKIPMFPFHTWLPDAHVEAPTAGSVILAGVLLKMGTYGFLRFCLPLFPLASVEFIPLIRALAVIGIVYGALLSLVQEDMKKLVAYSSVSHLGFCMLGMFSFNTIGLQGSILQMINHGLSTGALFLMVGIIYERRHTRLIADYGGIYRTMPKFATIFLLISFSSIGVPGLNGFVGELLIMIGAYQANLLSAAIATIGLILGPVYLLWMYKRVMLGKITKNENRAIPDLNVREMGYLIPIVFFIILIGINPKPFIRTTDVSVKHLIARVNTAVQNQLSISSEDANTINRIGNQVEKWE